MRLAYLPPGATPLPFRQILLLCISRIPEPINYTLIFPFINQMIVEETGVPVESVGFYSGLIEGVFSLVQFLSVFHWGALSDRIGRRPVILMGLVGVGISGTTFGLSKSFTTMLISRCLAGCLCGNVAVAKASLGELTDSTNQGVAFPLYGLTWILGTILGSTIGGLTSHPVERYPSIFGQSALFKEYPFLLPCAISGAITACGWIFAFFFLEETLERPATSYSKLSTSSPRSSSESHELLDSPSSTSQPFVPSHRRNSSSISSLNRDRPPSDGFGEDVPVEWGFWALLDLPLVRRVVASCLLMAMVSSAFGAIYLLEAFTSIDGGGLGLQSDQTGMTLAIQGVWSFVAQLVFLPPLQVRFGTARLYHAFNFSWVFIFFLLPFLNWLARHTSSTDSTPDGQGGLSFSTWVGVAFTLWLSVVVNTSGSLVMILVNSATPSKSALGKLNGITTMAGSIARSIGPALVSSLFALSQGSPTDPASPSSPPVRSKLLLGGNLWWVFMIILAVISGIVGFTVKEGDGRKSNHALDLEEGERAEGGLSRLSMLKTIDEEEGEGDDVFSRGGRLAGSDGIEEMAGRSELKKRLGEDEENEEEVQKVYDGSTAQ